MKATGIVRRIDDLGRVVIPKEIRRTMRIREGDPLEIYTERDGEVIFKKYSPIGELAVFAEAYAEVLWRNCKKGIIICDRDRCVAAAGISRREVIDRRNSASLEEIINARRSYAFTNGERRLPVLEGCEQSIGIAVPIISSGDIAGAVVFALDNGTPTAAELSIASVAAAFLGKQLEDI